MNRRIALVAIAVVLALVGTLAVYNYAHQADQRAIAGSRATQVLITVKKIPAGTSWGDVVKDDYAREESVPAASAPESALDTANSAGIPAAQVAAADVAPGQILMRPMFGDQTAVTGVLAIPVGKLAITVTMQSNADVAGFVAPKSEVAIFATWTVSVSSGSGQKVLGSTVSTTKMLLPRVTVIATSQAPPTNLSGSSGTSSSGAVLVTLAVTQAQAESVILAQSTGQLYLALLTDTSATGTDQGQVNVGTLQPAPITAQ